jgi:radical SAM protein with 4Fe4S-binding SPASM domain
MRASGNTLSLPLTSRIRDRMVSSLLKIIAPVGDSPEALPDLTPGSFTSRVLVWIGRLCGLDSLQLANTLTDEAERRALWNLLKSVSDCGLSTPQTLRAPVSVVWSLSYGCNLRCIHCYQNASRPSSDELRIDQQLSIVDQLAQAGVSMIVLSGGEPLTNPNLGRLIERIRSYEIAISIDSNGILLDRDIVETLRKSGVTSVELSVDSVNPESHDRFRGLDGAFKKTVEALEICSEAGMFTTIATTATALNYEDSSELISLASNHGADRIIFFDLIPAGRGRDIEELRLSGQQLLDLMALVRKESLRNGIEVFIELPQFVVYSSAVDGDLPSNHPERALCAERFTGSTFFDCAGRENAYRKFAPYLGGCPAGRIYGNIQPNGDVTPCMFMPQYPVAGNLKTQSFQEIWNSPPLRALRDRTLLKGKCRECKFTTVCGGCRAKAAVYNGDYLASDPTCPIYNGIA